ncbi:MAG TPA: DoxX family protein [Tepidisphaeraceae bacterium]|nr:DoxX family protein [Tepidisphaeraceae bacterium]
MLLHPPSFPLAAGTTGVWTTVMAAVAIAAVALFAWRQVRGGSSTGFTVDLGLLLLRLPLGVLFLMAGWRKVSGGVGNFVSMASGAVPSWMPESAGRAYLYAVPWAELIVGAMLIAGFLTHFTALITTLMLVSFIVAATGVTDPNGAPFNPNVGYACLALAIMLLGAGRISVDRFVPGRRGRGKKSSG